MIDVNRVLLVTPSYPPPPGGIQTLSANLERGLDAHGVDVRVLVTDSTPTDAAPRDVFSALRWCHSLRSVLSGEALSLAATYRRAAASIGDYRPDVVHAMHVVDWPALVAAAEANVPSVLTTHALELGRTSLTQAAVNEATRVHAVTEFTRDLTREVAESSVRSHVIPPSIPVSEYPTRRNTREDNSDAEPVHVTTVARLVKRKNVATLIDAVGRLNDRSDHDIRLRVIGDGPLRDDLERRAAGAPVTFEGWVSEARKRELLARSDIFALVPRRIGFDVEGFGIVYIEAQAAGVPVIGSSQGGVPEAIGDGGLVVNDERNPQEVATAFERLLTHDDTRRRCLDAAGKRIEGFDLRAIAGRHVDAYEGVLSGSAGPHTPAPEPHRS